MEQFAFGFVQQCRIIVIPLKELNAGYSINNWIMLSTDHSTSDQCVNFMAQREIAVIVISRIVRLEHFT